MYMWRERSKEEKHEDVVNTGLLPLDVVEGFKIRPGFFRMYGACVASNGVSFTINSHGATRCTLLLFKPQAPKPYARIPFPDSYRIGDTYSMLVFDIKPDEFEYAFSFDGPYEPAKGLLFNGENVLLDPYSRAVTGQRKWGEKPEGGKDFEYRARVVKSSFDWGNIKQLEQPFEDLVIYETHVRGYTKDKSSGVSAPGTFAGLKDKIPYLKDLGINAVELMPILSLMRWRAREWSMVCSFTITGATIQYHFCTEYQLCLQRGAQPRGRRAEIADKGFKGKGHRGHS